MWPFDNKIQGIVDQYNPHPASACQPVFDQQLLQNSPPTVGGLGQYTGTPVLTPSAGQYQPIHVGHPPNPYYQQLPGYPISETETCAEHRRMKDLILNSENNLILELTKMCADVTDESFRKIILNRIEAAEGRKLAVELADLN